jgi:hypothetical protein
VCFVPALAVIRPWRRSQVDVSGAQLAVDSSDDESAEEWEVAKGGGAVHSASASGATSQDALGGSPPHRGGVEQAGTGQSLRCAAKGGLRGQPAMMSFVQVNGVTAALLSGAYMYKLAHACGATAINSQVLARRGRKIPCFDEYDRLLLNCDVRAVRWV